MVTWQRAVLGIGSILVVGGLAVWGIHRRLLAQEARKLDTALEPYFTAESNHVWENLSLPSRVKTGRRALSALEKLQGTPWGITITDLRAMEEIDEEDAREAVFHLEAGDTELLDCTVSSPAGGPAGSCARFRHVVPSAEPRVQTVPLALYLVDRPYAESLASGRLVLGVDKGVQVEGTVRVDEQNVSVRDPVLLLPSPREPERIDRIPVAAFSPRTELALRSVKSYPFDVSYDMPAALSPFFDGSDRLRVFYAEVATSVDLTTAAPVYRLEGMLEVLNVPRGRVVLEYQPGHHAAAAVTDVSLPIALSNVCLNVDLALVEVDLVEDRLRVMGETRNGTVDHLACAGEPMDPFTRFGLDAALAGARAVFDLPSEWISQGQLVVDLNDRIFCGDLAVHGSSVLHAAYFGKETTFRMWAPWSFQKNGIRPDRPVGSLVDLGLGVLMADRTFPPTNPRRCWDGDGGPKIDLESTILSGWRQEQEDYGSPFSSVPASSLQ